MGKASRKRPARLGEKLVRIREELGLSQNGIIRRLALTDVISRDNVSAYELGRREPSLLVLLQYARAAGVCLDTLVDDDADLPKKLPSRPRHKAR
jgi:transcriptional regulator with XRE-family HTH domain